MVWEVEELAVWGVWEREGGRRGEQGGRRGLEGGGGGGREGGVVGEEEEGGRINRL